MNDSQPSTIPKDTTGSSILEQENNSEVTEDEQQTTKMETADSSASLEAKMEKESENESVDQVSRSPELEPGRERVSQTKPLINRTRERLAVTVGFCMNMKNTKKALR